MIRMGLSERDGSDFAREEGKECGDIFWRYSLR